MADQPKHLKGSHLSLATKLAGVATATMFAILGAQLWLLDHWTGPRALVMLTPMVIGPIIVLFLTRFIVMRMTLPLMTAYGRMAAGDLRAQLPPMTAGADFIGVRASFAAMGAALEASMQKIRQQDEDRRRLFADLAHELATPTSTLIGIAEALRKGGAADRERLLDHLETESARLERLIADVREVAHLEDPAMAMLCEPCDVAELAAKAVERARLAAPDDGQLSCDAEAAPASVDPIRIDQVLVNLISNAIRHARGGQVAVRVRGGQSRVTLRVEDSGPGVPDEMLPALGRRLLRVDPMRSRDSGGHGLGLSIVRAIVARHGGQVTFSRAALGGLAVEVELPRETPPAPV